MAETEAPQKKGLSLKYKLLILLVALPVVTLALYLVVATGLFKSDKIAYVFDSSSVVTRTVSSQVREKLNVAVSVVSLVVGNFDPRNRRFGSTARTVFQKNSEIESIQVYRLSKSGKATSLNRQKKKSFDPNNYAEDFNGAIKSLTEDANEFGFSLYSNNGVEGYTLMALKIPYKGRDYLAISGHKFTDISKMFKKRAFYSGFLINGRGEILLGPDKDQSAVMGETDNFSGWNFFSKILEQNLPAGTNESTSPTGVPVLVSFSKIGRGDLFTVAFVKKDVALRAVDALLLKSLLFFIALISFAVIVSVISASKLTATLTSLSESTERVSQGDFDIHVEVKSNDEVGNLARGFNRMAEEVSRLMDKTADAARMEKELETAKTVQDTLFPRPAYSKEGMHISGFYEPASECGGDWWHYCEIGDKLFLWIGDATGHGVPAALVTSAAKSAATLLEKFNKITPGKALGHLNRSIHHTAKGGIMMTFFIACFDRKTGELSYACASHDPPYKLKAKGEKPLRKKDLKPLNKVNNLRLGEGSDTKYAETTIKLEPGEQVVFYTDGVFDVLNPEGEAFGEKNFVKLLAKVHHETNRVEEFVEGVKAKLFDHRGDTEMPDDITFFTFRFDPNVDDIAA
jgi:sigma-B regulation protein RsbU (phosphoserine phosphatase)